MVMRRSCPAVVLLVSLIAFVARPAAADGITVTRPAATQPATWTADKLRADFASQLKVIEHTSHGQAHKSTCVPLLAVLQAAGVQSDVGKNPTADPKVKNAALRLVVVVTGRDGYVATFSLAELLPEIGNREAWLAIDQDGQPLAERDGPVKLVVPSDAKPGRWVHAVRSIAVIDPISR